MKWLILIESIWILVPVVVFAALIRGYAGFGFAAIAVVGFNLFISPQQSIPVILGLDVLCSIGLLRQALQQADRATFKMLVVGALFGIPIGLSLLFIVPEELLKLLICIAILVLALLILFDFRLRQAERKSTQLGFGLASGLGTAGASVGGPMIVCYMLSSQLSPTTQRATMILFFIVSESLAVLALASSGLVDIDVIKLMVILLIPTLIAVRIGQGLFNRKPPKSLKHFALPVLLMMALLGISASLEKLI
jgi:uncharacterized membrane protein YfcA